MVGRFLQRVGDLSHGLSGAVSRSLIRLTEWRHLGPIRRTLFYCGLFLPLAYVLTVFSIAYVNGVLRVGGRSIWQDFEAADQRAMATAVYDSRDRFAGVVHPEGEPDHLGEFSRQQTMVRGIFPDHKTVPVFDAPTFFWRCAVFAEDRHRGSFRNPFGVDALSVAAMPLTGRGGSTIEMQLARSLWKLDPGAADRYELKGLERVFFNLDRKVNEWRAAPVLRAELTRGSSDLKLRRWYANHPPLVSSGGEETGSVYGVYATSQYLFGKRPEQLSIIEQLVLADGLRVPFIWRAQPVRDDFETEEAFDEASTRMMLSRKSQLQRAIGTPEKPGRARLCADKNSRLADGRPVVTDEALRELFPGVPDQDLRERFSESLTAFAQEDLVPVAVGFEEALKPLGEGTGVVRFGSTRIIMTLAPNVQREVSAALAEHFRAKDETSDGSSFGVFAHRWRGRVREIRLTIDLEKNFAFRDQIKTALPLLSSELASTRRYRSGTLPRIDDDGVFRSGDTPVLLVAADEKGRMVRYYNSGGDSFFYGRLQQRENLWIWGAGAYETRLERRSVGSIAKVAAAILIAAGGETNPQRSISNRCLAGLQDNCFQDGAVGVARTATLNQIFAWSLNAPLIRLLESRTDEQTVLSLMRELGFRDPSDTTYISTELTLGRFGGRPRSALWLASVAATLAEDRPGPVPAPYLIETMAELDASDLDGERQAPMLALSTQTFDASDLARAVDPEFLKSVLSSPLCDRSGKATLRRLSAWCASSNSNVAFHIAKSGTVSACGERDPVCRSTLPVCGDRLCNEMDWWIIGAITFSDGRRYSYVATMGSADRRTAFAADLGGGRLAPLVDILITDLLERGS